MFYAKTYENSLLLPGVNIDWFLVRYLQLVYYFNSVGIQHVPEKVGPKNTDKFGTM